MIQANKPLSEQLNAQLKTLTSHPHVTLTHRGDGAIFMALHIVKCMHAKTTNYNAQNYKPQTTKIHTPQTPNYKPPTTNIHTTQTTNNTQPPTHSTPPTTYNQIILIPDQAGWLSFRTLPPLVGFNVIEVKTDNGLIDLADLELKTKSEKPAAFLIQSLAGYFVEQPMADIIKLCRQNNCLVVEDISGSIGFLPGYDSDIKVCSFGRGKLVNAGTGGCLSCKEDFPALFAEHLAPVLRLVRPLFDTSDASLLKQKLDGLKARTAFLSAKAQKIKSDLAHCDILHRESRSINVVIQYAADTQDDAGKKEIIEYCMRNGYKHTLCPRYIRAECPAVCIEVKRL